MQTNTLVGFDYRKNYYKELDTWGTLCHSILPLILRLLRVQAVALDYVEPFVTYGYLVDQRFDFNNYGGISGGLERITPRFWSRFKTFHVPPFNGYVNLQAFKFWNPIVNIVPAFKLRAAYGKAVFNPVLSTDTRLLTYSPTGNELAYTSQTGAGGTTPPEIQTSMLRFLQKKK
jgi:hypothetical protein